MCRQVPKVPYGSYAPVSDIYTVYEYHIITMYIYSGCGHGSIIFLVPVAVWNESKYVNKLLYL
jgi:hypothetical protein